MQLGFEIHSSVQLHADKYKFVQDPRHPNLILFQIDSEYDYRPVRYICNETKRLETEGERIPASAI